MDPRSRGNPRERDSRQTREGGDGLEGGGQPLRRTSPDARGTKTLTSVAKPLVVREAEVAWERQWDQAQHGRTSYHIQKIPDAKVLAKYQGLLRPYCLALVQMRTGEIGLQSYLNRIGATPTARCSCGEGPQTVQHVLLACPLYANLREVMFKDGRQDDLKRILGEPALAKKAAEYMIDTGILPQFRWIHNARRRHESWIDCLYLTKPPNA